ncbi:hypothetical protein F4679DRAFT_106063 [Xylaria curta]|nr:hypothetical protein F4679DRAFT_106063 [Xylaria curta]
MKYNLCCAPCSLFNKRSQSSSSQGQQSAMQTTQQSTQPQDGSLSASDPQSNLQQSRIGVYTDAGTGTPHNQSIAASAKPYSSLIACNDFSAELYGAAASSSLRSGMGRLSSLAAMRSASSGRKDSHPRSSSASVIRRK